MVKPSMKIEVGQLCVNQKVIPSKLYGQPRSFTWTQKKRWQRNKAISKIKQTLAMIVDLKTKGQIETIVNQVSIALDQAFGGHPSNSKEKTTISVDSAKYVPVELIKEKKDEMDSVEANLILEEKQDESVAQAQEEPIDQELKQIENLLLEAQLNDDDLLDAEVDAMSLIPSGFQASTYQNKSLDGHICSKETDWDTIGEDDL